ncbi:DUF6503 family protein [Polaribacter porphyrae]|uniref:Threonine synthase n=1 Tax=Polaribacter porphyrae TaxID=1137780 RepID=A0A2S7WKB2_9FLAO|nr:DUF6503 family protein [Polaribacter porphyrae]PQJ78057.1 hypothetical protein BTO18_02110 [Polaribacter porphyrae]
MNKIIVFLVFSLAIISCKKEVKKETQVKKTVVEKKENFPNELDKVFTKHGGIDTWRKAKVLSFNKGKEVHTIDLHSRKTVINHPKYSLGFDGKEVWLDEEDKGNYKGNPTFYYNLYFYFYAMPFVLADDGIIYEKVNGITFEEVTYPGIKISYEANVGISPDDNYIIYYNPETYQMEWLAYTVTFKTKKPSDRYNILKYNKWENVNGLILPKEVLWYKKDANGNPNKPAGTPTEFTLPLVSQGKLADSFFEKPLK